MSKKDDALGGEKDLALKVEAGLDPNADLSADADTKSQAALSLAMMGANYTDIARVVGYASATLARTAVERALASAANTPDKVEQMRKLQDMRLKRLLQAHMGKAINPEDKEQLAYSARALAIIDRISKLHGLDAVQQVQVTVTDETIMSYVNNLAKLAGIETQAVEGEIFDAEIIDDNGE